MKKLLTTIVMATILIASASISMAQQQVIFEDDFNRADGTVIGNGWHQYTMLQDVIEIVNEEVRLSKNDVHPGVNTYEGFTPLWHYFSANSSPDLVISAKMRFQPYINYGSYFAVHEGTIDIYDPTGEKHKHVVGLIKQISPGHLRLNYFQNDMEPGTYADVPYFPNTWYNLSFHSFDFSNQTYKISMSGSENGPFPMRQHDNVVHTSVDAVMFQVNGHASGLSMEIDDVLVQEEGGGGDTNCNVQVYTQDFSNNPNFTHAYSLESGEYFTWNPVEEVYKVKIKEFHEAWKYAYSPVFPTVANESFDVSIDVKLVETSYGFPMRIHFIDGALGGPQLSITHNGSHDPVWNVSDGTGISTLSGDAQQGVWYNFKITHDNDNLITDVVIRNRTTNAIFFAEYGIPSSPAAFSQIIFGAHTANHDGTWGEMHYDNISINKCEPDNETYLIALDIKPGSCPNPVNFRSRGKRILSNDADDVSWTTDPGEGLTKLTPLDQPYGAVVPTAILGAVNFDIFDLDVESITLEGVPALRWALEDVAAPIDPDASECECNTFGPDGFTDLTLKFSRAALKEALGEVIDGEILTLTLSGVLFDGTPIEGQDCIVVIGDREPTEANSFALTTFPNPFNPTTTIQFDMPMSSTYEMTIYNITGQVVEQQSGYSEAGMVFVEWNASDNASGVYFYRLQVGDLSETRKMVLLK